MRKDLEGKMQEGVKMECVWTDEYQEAFSLSNSLVLDSPDFSQPFEMETDALLQGMGAMLSQRHENGQSRVIVCARKSLCKNEQLMLNYSLAKLKLLMLKWTVMENWYTAF